MKPQSALEWRRVDTAADPCAYFNDSNRYAIFPGSDHGWELCWMVDSDSGYDYMGWFRTVAGAKAEAEYLATRDSDKRAKPQ